MANPIKFISCMINGHEVDPYESIMRDVMINPNNWLCPCHHCGFYIAYDELRNIKVPMTRKSAFKLKEEFLSTFPKRTPEEVSQIRIDLYGRR